MEAGLRGDDDDVVDGVADDGGDGKALSMRLLALGCSHACY